MGVFGQSPTWPPFIHFRRLAQLARSSFAANIRTEKGTEYSEAPLLDYHFLFSLVSPGPLPAHFFTRYLTPVNISYRRPGLVSPLHRRHQSIAETERKRERERGGGGKDNTAKKCRHVEIIYKRSVGCPLSHCVHTPNGEARANKSATHQHERTPRFPSRSSGAGG